MPSCWGGDNGQQTLIVDVNSSIHDSIQDAAPEDNQVTVAINRL